MIIEGRCHCGAVHAALETALDPDVIQVRACQCDFCRSHGARTVSDPQGKLSFRFREDAVNRYRFATRSADFLICRTCGAYVGAIIAEDQVGVINAAGLGIDLFALRAADPVRYDSESPEDKRARRRKRWAPVTLEDAP
jgi:hypothetical protein